MASPLLFLLIDFALILEVPSQSPSTLLPARARGLTGKVGRRSTREDRSEGHRDHNRGTESEGLGH